jgi:hypothetical protein
MGTDLDNSCRDYVGPLALGPGKASLSYGATFTTSWARILEVLPPPETQIPFGNDKAKSKGGYREEVLRE